jgi:hypothetical protein
VSRWAGFDLNKAWGSCWGRPVGQLAEEAELVGRGGFD